LRWLRKGSLILIILIPIFLAVNYGLENYRTKKPQRFQVATILPAQAIASFSLVTDQETSFTAHSLKGFWTLMFFGYSHCPDICPKTLGVMRQVWDQVLKEVPFAKLQFTFVSLDPATDTSARLKEYLSYVNPKFIGLTGELAEVQKLRQFLGIHSLKENSTGLIDHSATLVVFNPRGQLYAIFTPPHHAESIAADLEHMIKG